MHVRLYKRGRRGIRYWEAWTRQGVATWGVVHEGKVGERGKAKDLLPWPDHPVGQQIAEAAQKVRQKGYAEIPMEDHYQIVVHYRLQTWAAVADLDKAHRIEDLFNECLGWTGNGFCDGNDIGSGTMNIYSLVVDPELGAAMLVEELRKNRLLKGAVVAVREGEDYRVVYPTRFKGEFALF